MNIINYRVVLARIYEANITYQFDKLNRAKIEKINN